MLLAVFIILLEINRQSVGLNENILLLMAGMGLIVLVFILRRFGGKNDETNLRF